MTNVVLLVGLQQECMQKVAADYAKVERLSAVGGRSQQLLSQEVRDVEFRSSVWITNMLTPVCLSCVAM